MHYLTKPDESRPSKVTYDGWPEAWVAASGPSTSIWLNPVGTLTVGKMSAILPGSESFMAPVYGTVFARRSEVVHRLESGDRLILVPDPPGAEPPTVWVHARGGDVVGHLSPDLSAWLAPWMLAGWCYAAEVSVRRGDEVASWQRLVITVWRVAAAKSA